MGHLLLKTKAALSFFRERGPRKLLSRAVQLQNGVTDHRHRPSQRRRRGVLNLERDEKSRIARQCCYAESLLQLYQFPGSSDYILDWQIQSLCTSQPLGRYGMTP